MRCRESLLVLCAALLSVGIAPAGPVYTQDSDLSHFTGTVATGNYATFTDGYLQSTFAPFAELSTSWSYTPTDDILNATNYPRVIGNDASPPIVVQFAAPTSEILVFSNSDHPESDWDAYQYSIYGGTLIGSSLTFTLLFDPTSTNGAGPNFTLVNWTGTAPTLVNNTLTPGLGADWGSIGYEAYFSFAHAYQFYGFRTSTLSVTTGEVEQELSAVAQAVPAPEPASWGTLLIALVIGGARLRYLRRPE